MPCLKTMRRLAKTINQSWNSLTSPVIGWPSWQLSLGYHGTCVIVFPTTGFPYPNLTSNLLHRCLFPVEACNSELGRTAKGGHASITYILLENGQTF